MKYKKTNYKYKKNYGGELNKEQVAEQQAWKDYQTAQGLSSAVDTGVSMIPGWGAVYGAAAGVSNSVSGMIGEEKYNPETGKVAKEYSSDGAAALDNAITPAHENMLNSISEENYGTAAMDILLPGSVATGKLFGNDMKFNNGGYIKANGGELIKFNEGGTHEQNPNGGIPLGASASVEQGETQHGDYIYSDRLKVNKKLAEEFSLPKKAIGKTFAEVSKMYEDESRPNDIYSNRMKVKELENLKQAHEAYKQVEGIDQPQQQFGNGGPKYANTEEMVRQEGFMLPYLGQAMKHLANVSNNSDSIYNVYDNLPPEEQKKFAEQAVGSYYRKENPMNQNYQVTNTKAMSLGGPTTGAVLGTQNLDPLASLTYGDIYSNPTVNIPSKNLNVDGSLPDINNITKSVGVNAPTSPSSDVNNKNGYADYLKYASVASEVGNMINLLSNKPKAKNLDMFDTNSKFKENLVNRDQIKRDITSQGKSIERKLADSAGGNAGTLMSNILGASTNTQRALANANMSSDELDSREKARIQALKYQQDARNQGMRMRVADMNDQDAGVYQGLLLDSTSALGQNLGNIGLEEQNLKMASNLPINYYVDRFGNVRHKDYGK